MTIQRTLPVGVREYLERETNEQVLLVFLTITHPELDSPIYVVKDAAKFVLDGNEHIGYDFEIRLLTDDDSPPTARLTIANVDKRIGQTLLKAVNPAKLEIQVIASDQFDLSVEPRTEIAPASRMYRAFELYLTNTEGDTLTVSGTIRSWDYTQETWPALRATEARFPGLYW